MNESDSPQQPVSSPVTPAAPDMPPIVPTQSNGMATAALILGILSVPFCPLSILAIIFGIIGMVRSGKVNKGKGPAIAGLVLGCVMLLVPCTILLPALTRARTLAKHAMSMTNLNGIGKATMLYSYQYDDKLPTRAELLVEKGYASEKMFKNPSSSNEPPRIVNGKFQGEVGYIVFLDFPEDADGNMIMGYEKLKYALPGKVAVLTLNGRIKNMSPEQLKAQLLAEGRPPAE